MTRTHLDAKDMARSLRASLQASGITVSHAQALEAVAAQFGYRDWNTLAATVNDVGGVSPRAGTAWPGAGGASHRGGSQSSPTGDVQLDEAVPVLRMLDVARAREFYVDFLGFRVDFEHRFEPALPLYLQVSCGGVVLHLSEHHGDGVPGSMVFVWMTGIELFRAELLGKNYSYARPGIENQEWGREFAVTDPSGNTLRFCESGAGAST